MLTLIQRSRPCQKDVPKKNQREGWYSLCLDQRRDFKEFIQRAEAARHKNKGDAVFDKANLAREEIMKMDRHVSEPVAPLLAREFDVQTNGFAANRGSP